MTWQVCLACLVWFGAGVVSTVIVELVLLGFVAREIDRREVFGEKDVE